MLLKSIESKDVDKQKILDLYRHNTIDITDVEEQLQKIGAEKERIKLRIEEIIKIIEGVKLSEIQFDSINSILLEYQQRLLEGDLTFEEKRVIVKAFTREVKVTSCEPTQENPAGIKLNMVYCFAQDVTCTGRGSYNNLGIIKKVSYKHYTKK
jgi:site-specific DNA recombinase